MFSQNWKCSLTETKRRKNTSLMLLFKYDLFQGGKKTVSLVGLGEHKTQDRVQQFKHIPGVCF